jgi:hypothetical protein
MRLDLLNSHLYTPCPVQFSTFSHITIALFPFNSFFSVLPYALFLELDDWNDLMCMYQALVSLHWSHRFFSACVLYVEL